MLPQKSWKFEGIILLVAGILLSISTLTLIEAVLQHFLGRAIFDEGSLLFLVFGSLSLHGSILVGVGVFLWWHNVSWSEAFGFSKPRLGRAILFGLIVALVFIPVGSALQDVSVKALTWAQGKSPPPQEAIAEFDTATSWPSRAYLAAFAIILAPFAEEVFFRGILYTAVKQTGHPKLALWASAIIFAAIHHSAAIFLPLLVLGLMLAGLYEKTGNLVASMTAHAFFNAVNVGLLLFGDQLEQVPHQTLRHLP